MNDKPWSGRPWISKETVTIAQEDFERSPQKSARHVSAELNIPHTTVHKILKVKLHDHAYKIHVVQMLQEDYHVSLNLCQYIDQKSPFPTNFLKTWHFLMRQLFISVAKSTAKTATCGKGETSRSPATLKRLPRIKCLVCPQEVVRYPSFLF